MPLHQRRDSLEMATNESTWWVAAGTILCGVATVVGIIGAFLEWPPRALWLSLWWGGMVLWAWFAHRWLVARKATRSP